MRWCPRIPFMRLGGMGGGEEGGKGEEGGMWGWGQGGVGDGRWEEEVDWEEDMEGEGG